MNLRFYGARREKGLSQDDLAKHAGVSRFDIGRIDAGWIPPRDIQERLAEALAVPASELFDLGQAVSERHA